MKTLSDNNKVPSRTFYYLLEWNDKNNKEYIATNFNKHRLIDLNINEYIQLFKYVTEDELNKLNSYGNNNINNNN